MLPDDPKQRRVVKYKPRRAQNRALRNTKMNRSRGRSNTRDRYRLRSVRNLRTEPEQRRPRYT
jgi:hypothetical protein